MTGDTVGDPLKDTSGPALNIVMKLTAIISLVFGSAIADFSNKDRPRENMFGVNMLLAEYHQNTLK